MKTIGDGALEHVGRLPLQIGSRPIGTTANMAVEDYINEAFRQCGLSLNKQAETVPFVLDLIEVLDDKDVSWSRPKK